MQKSEWFEVIEGVKNSDQNKTQIFIEKTKDKLIEFCFCLCGNQQLAEDLCHDTYLKAILNIHQLQQVEKVSAWLKKIARNFYLDYVSSASVTKLQLIDHESKFEPFFQMESLNTSVSTMDAIAVLEKLSSSDREMIILSDVYGHSYQELSEILGIELGTVKSRLNRARNQFSKRYFKAKKEVS